MKILKWLVMIILLRQAISLIKLIRWILTTGWVNMIKMSCKSGPDFSDDINLVSLLVHSKSTGGDLLDPGLLKLAASVIVNTHL